MSDVGTSIIDIMQDVVSADVAAYGVGWPDKVPPPPTTGTNGGETVEIPVTDHGLVISDLSAQAVAYAAQAVISAPLARAFAPWIALAVAAVFVAVGVLALATHGAAPVPAPSAPAPATASAPTPTPTPTTAAPRYPGPIQAIFDQSVYSTFYTEPVTDPSWKYAWSVSIPVDPNCASGFHGNAPSPYQATWYHADQTEGGPCNHSGNAYNDTTGHPGQVTLVVTPADRSWTCTATFFGTAPNTSPGGPPMVGDSPQCSPK